jgi:NADP-dependent 3-hydroxy acid dehydrogenase YdfG
MGVMYATHVVLPLMKAQGCGHIVNLSAARWAHSIGGQCRLQCHPRGTSAPFPKHCARRSRKTHIRVNVIEPGVVATDMQRAVTDQAATGPAAEVIRSIPPIQSEDIAGAIVYAVTQPAQVDVGELLIRPTEEAF